MPHVHVFFIYRQLVYLKLLFLLLTALEIFVSTDVHIQYIQINLK